MSRNVPVFEIQLKGLNLTEGDELKLVCKVNSDTAITAKWFRDGVEVAPDPLVATKIEPDGSVLLTIASCIPGDAGKYRCEVTNQTGTSSSEANVSVKALKREKPIIIDGLKATAFDEDKPGKVEAKVGGFPKPDVHWLKDGKPITDPRIKIETKPDGTTILAIDKVKPEDAGEYSIVAKNDQGENKSSAPVTVNSKLNRQSYLIKTRTQGHRIISDRHMKYDIYYMTFRVYGRLNRACQFYVVFPEEYLFF